MEREYFEAKFEGLEKLLSYQQATLRDHIVAVSTNVKRVESDLNAHKGACPASASVRDLETELTKHSDSMDEHGIRAVDVAKTQEDLKEHKESLDAHGRASTDRFSATAISWLSLALASIVAAFEFRKH